jgi:hypothetical protein
MHFFHFSDTYYFGSNDSIKFVESTIAFDSFLEGRSSTSSRLHLNSQSAIPSAVIHIKMISHFEDSNVSI